MLYVTKSWQVYLAAVIVLHYQFFFIFGGWVGGFSLVLSVQGEGYQCRSCGAKTIEGAAGFFLGGQHINVWSFS